MASSARRESEVTERVSPPDGVLRSGYDTGGFYDEAFERDAGGAVVPRPHYSELIAQIAAMAGSELRRRGAREPVVPAPRRDVHRLLGR